MGNSCKNCGLPFAPNSEDLDLLERLAPSIGGQRFLLPQPTFCPDCRLWRRFSFRNERNLYHRKSDLSGREIVTMYSPDKPYKVYDQDEWWGDGWDGLTYGREFDFNRPFTDQFAELDLAVPHVSLFTRNVENSYFTNFSLNSKDCYLSFGCTNSERCSYCNFVRECRDCLDCWSIVNSELCYEGCASQGCYNCQWFADCRDCSDSLLLSECTSCKCCIACVGLHRAEYCVLNKPVGKAEYERMRNELAPFGGAAFKQLRAAWLELKLSLPHRANHIYSSENCSGDVIFESKNCQHCFDTTLSEDSRYLCFTPRAKNSMDGTFNAPGGLELCYEVCSCEGSSRSVANFGSWMNDQVLYSRDCHFSQNLFGCVGLKRQQYCILNKNYSPDEYNRLVPRIIAHMTNTGEWGEFFPSRISHFAYNESLAHEFMPIEKEIVLSQGARWHDTPPAKIPAGAKGVTPLDRELSDRELATRVFICAESQAPFKLNLQEIKFYRQQQLELPTLAPNQRYRHRLASRNRRMLWERKCGKCLKSIKTTFAPQQPETVYCEECYIAARY